jgi:hypothetical protein
MINPRGSDQRAGPGMRERLVRSPRLLCPDFHSTHVEASSPALRMPPTTRSTSSAWRDSRWIGTRALAGRSGGARVGLDHDRNVSWRRRTALRRVPVAVSSSATASVGHIRLRPTCAQCAGARLRSLVPPLVAVREASISSDCRRPDPPSGTSLYRPCPSEGCTNGL